MDAVEYVKTLCRMHESQDCYYGSIPGCPLLHKDDEDCYCVANMREYAEKAVQIVEQWANDNPVKSRQSAFLEIFPNAPKSGRVLDICPRSLNTEYMPPKRCENTSCGVCKIDYWSEEVTGND